MAAKSTMCVSLVFLLTCFAALAQDLTLEQILRKNEEALGGAEALRNIQTLKIIHKIEPSQQTMFLKRPHCSRSEVLMGGNGITSVECGTSGWIYNPASETPLQTFQRSTPNTFEGNLASIVDWLAFFKIAGSTVELTGREEVRDKPAYRIEVTSQSGDLTIYHVDMETFLPVKKSRTLDISGMALETERYPGDYREIDGITFAHSVDSITRMGNSGERRNTEIFEGISVNIPIDDKIFEMPAGVKSVERKSTPRESMKGRIERVKVHGKSLEGNLSGDPADREVAVYLPPSYTAEPERRYPVIYFLHGFGNGYLAWTAPIIQNSVPMVAEKAFNAGSREVIAVIPDAFTAFQGSMYSNSVTTGDWESFIARDLVSYIDEHYRTIPDRNSRGLAGHSMGGYGTIRIDMKHPEVFSSLYSLSACCMSPTMNPQPPTMAEAAKVKSLKEMGNAQFAVAAMLASAAAWSPNPNRPPLYLDLPIEDGKERQEVVAKWAANAPLAMIHQYVPNLKQYRAIAFDIGDKDIVDTGTEELILQPARDLDRILDDYGIEHTFEIYDGDHSNRIPERLETKVFPFFSENLVFD